MKFQYKIETYTKDQAGLTKLNNDGQAGWDIAFVVSETTTAYKILMKRRYE